MLDFQALTTFGTLKPHFRACESLSSKSSDLANSFCRKWGSVGKWYFLTSGCSQLWTCLQYYNKALLVYFFRWDRSQRCALDGLPCTSSNPMPFFLQSNTGMERFGKSALCLPLAAAVWGHRSSWQARASWLPPVLRSVQLVEQSLLPRQRARTKCRDRWNWNQSEFVLRCCLLWGGGKSAQSPCLVQCCHCLQDCMCLVR